MLPCDTVPKYLSCYTHRVAIFNAPPLKLRSAGGRRILSVGDGAVRFQYRDYADHNRSKEMTLPAAELLRRFLLHVVPRGFMCIRHYEVPELPGCAADGATYKQALANAEVVIREWIETARELGRPIPEPKGRLLYA